MTTQKTLKKVYECIAANSELNVDDYGTKNLILLFANYFHPRTFKKNPTKATTKTNYDLEICQKLGYLKIDYNSSSLEYFIELTQEGAKRLESKADSLRNLVVRILCALGGAASTVACSFLIELIKSRF